MCLTQVSLASAQVIQHVMSLITQALLDASCDHTLPPTHAGLVNSALYAAGPT